MNYFEALAITGSQNKTDNIRNTGACYWLASADTGSTEISNMWYCSELGSLTWSRQDIYSYLSCWGIRPVVTMAEGVYIKSGSGTEEDPYILGKD